MYNMYNWEFSSTPYLCTQSIAIQKSCQAKNPSYGCTHCSCTWYLYRTWKRLRASGFQGVGNAQSHGCHLCEQGLWVLVSLDQRCGLHWKIGCISTQQITCVTTFSNANFWTPNRFFVHWKTVGLQTCLQMLPRFWKPIAPQSAWSCPNSRELWLGRDFCLVALRDRNKISWQQQPQQQQEQQRCYQSGILIVCSLLTSKHSWLTTGRLDSFQLRCNRHTLDPGSFPVDGWSRWSSENALRLSGRLWHSTLCGDSASWRAELVLLKWLEQWHVATKRVGSCHDIHH